MLLISDALDVLYGKWKLRILMAIVRGNTRYKDIMEGNPGLTDKILSQNLRSLMDDGLIERVVSTIGTFSRLMVEYRLTPHGASLHPLMDALARWGAEHRRYIIDGVQKK
ncbi:MAG: helix-turn-helix transcriptional regulator [Muribaculaceae bacterium]|nr:helix-turn-helix transcriptional regulator [Muribaculaceae bacterium]